MKKLLYIAYHFPPYGGAGVQRSLKFVKYLPSYGISPTVLTSSSPPDQKWSPADTTLAHEIPPEIPVLRTVWRAFDSYQAEFPRTGCVCYAIGIGNAPSLR